MSIKGKAFIAGAYELNLRDATGRSLAALHAQAAQGALADAGLSLLNQRQAIPAAPRTGIRMTSAYHQVIQNN